MKEITVDWLRSELIRLGAVIAETRVLHDSGVRLHVPGDPIAPAQLQLMQDLGMKRLHLLEPGEMEAAATQALEVERVSTHALEAGDRIFVELRDPTGAVILPAGGAVDSRAIAALAPYPPQVVAIRKRFLDAAREQARLYLAGVPAKEARAKRPDTRVTQVTAGREDRVRFPLVPRAKVRVALREDFQRTVVVNTLLAEGHEAAEVAPGRAVAEVRESKADVLLVDLADAAFVAGELRKSFPLFQTAVLAAAGEGKGGEVYKALGAGANGSVPAPVRRDRLLESVRGALAALGKSVRLRPAVLGERRKAARENGNFICSIADRFLSKPLPVTELMVLDVTDEGMRVEYTRPAWPAPWAYIAHSVHPKHFWYDYSRLNALGREFVVVLPAPGRAPVEISASVAYVAPSGPLEVMGLSLIRSRGSVKEQVTTIRGQAPGSRRS